MASDVQRVYGSVPDKVRVHGLVSDKQRVYGMAKGGLVPGKVVNPAKKVDMKGVVKGKGENLAGTPRSGGIDPHSAPGAKKFDSVTRIKDTRSYPKQQR